jgi:hypothetical protein
VARVRHTEMFKPVTVSSGGHGRFFRLETNPREHGYIEEA